MSSELVSQATKYLQLLKVHEGTEHAVVAAHEARDKAQQQVDDAKAALLRVAGPEKQVLTFGSVVMYVSHDGIELVKAIEATPVSMPAEAFYEERQPAPRDENRAARVREVAERVRPQVIREYTKR